MIRNVISTVFLSLVFLLLFLRLFDLDRGKRERNKTGGERRNIVFVWCSFGIVAANKTNDFLGGLAVCGGWIVNGLTRDGWDILLNKSVVD